MLYLVCSQSIHSAGIKSVGHAGQLVGDGAVPVRSGLREARGLMLAWLANEALERLDVLILLLIASRQTMGFYAAAAPMAAAMIIVPNSLGFVRL